jgi:hypothetical protein
LLLAVAGSHEVWACSCVPPPPPREALQEAAAVFSGTVVELQTAGDGRLQATLDVDTAWKHAGRYAEETYVVGTPSDGAMCGFPFRLGERYIVYAYRDDPGDPAGPLETHLCTRTRLYDPAEAAELGSPSTCWGRPRLNLSVDPRRPAAGHRFTLHIEYLELGLPLTYLILAPEGRAVFDPPLEESPGSEQRCLSTAHPTGCRALGLRALEAGELRIYVRASGEDCVCVDGQRCAYTWKGSASGAVALEIGPAEPAAFNYLPLNKVFRLTDALR